MSLAAISFSFSCKSRTVVAHLFRSVIAVCQIFKSWALFDPSVCTMSLTFFGTFCSLQMPSVGVPAKHHSINFSTFCCILNCTSERTSLRFNGHFPGEPGSACVH